MMLRLKGASAALLGAGLLALTAVPAMAATATFSSTAYSVFVNMTVNGASSLGGPMALATGAGPAAYDIKQVDTNDGFLVPLPNVNTAMPLGIYVTLKGGTNQAEGFPTAPGVNAAAQTTGTAAAQTLTMALENPFASKPVPLISVVAKSIRVVAGATTRPNGKVTGTSKETVGSLTISGTMLPKPVVLTGKIAPGIVLDTPTLRISVHETVQVLISGVSTQTGVQTYGVDVEFIGTMLSGATANGHVYMAAAAAL